MANVIAVIWDFDKTLVNGYMQDPIFEEFKVDSNEFWKEVNELPKFYKENQGVKVNADLIYLNHFINKTKNGTFKGLNNQKLREFGKKQKFYDGIPEIFQKITDLTKSDKRYSEYDIKVEHYIVSTGMTEVIKGSVVKEYVEGIWGCEFIEAELGEEKIISEIGYTIDNTTKTKALFEINKGVNVHEDIDGNSKVPDSLRRVPFQNMIYIADGPSDVPAFSVVKKNGGKTFAIYPKGDDKAFAQVDQLRKDGRVDMFAEADYTESTTAFMWIKKSVLEIANSIKETEENKLRDSVSSSPKHLI